MPRNIEIKARIHSVEALLPRARVLADGDALLIEQDDSFYRVPNGRLKLRRFPSKRGDGSHRSGGSDSSDSSDGNGAELIHYHRPDSAEAKASDYVRVPVPDPDALHQALTRGCGLLGSVQKTRWLLLVGPTRIHLDRVAGLGDFMELEVVLTESQSDADGVAIAEALMQQLGLGQAPRVAGAYLDLIAAAATEATPGIPAHRRDEAPAVVIAAP